MSDADLFRRYAKEAMHESFEATSKNEKRALADLACTWAQAALSGAAAEKIAGKVRQRDTKA
jgi:hypothetical protein